MLLVRQKVQKLKKLSQKTKSSWRYRDASLGNQPAIPAATIAIRTQIADCHYFFNGISF